MIITIQDGPRSLSGNTIQGIALWCATFAVSGLAQGATDTFSLTGNGTPGGSPLLAPKPTLFYPPIYVPTDTTNLGAWAEAAVPTIDTNGNLQLSLDIPSGGPTSFRIGLVWAAYGVA